MPIGKRQVEQMAARAARDFDDFYALREVTEEDTDDLLVLTFDGKGVPMRHEDLRPETRAAAEATPRRLHTRLTKGEKRHRKRMAQVAAIYTVAPYVRTPADVLADLRPVRDAGAIGTGLGPRDKRVWASLTKPPASVIRDAFEQARRRDPSFKRTWVVLLDGNRDPLKLVKKAARKLGVAITILVDLIHVLEYLWKAAYAFHKDGSKEAEQWVQQRLMWLLLGEPAKVSENLRRNARHREVLDHVGVDRAGEGREDLDVLCLELRAERLRDRVRDVSSARGMTRGPSSATFLGSRAAAYTLAAPASKSAETRAFPSPQLEPLTRALRRRAPLRALEVPLPLTRIPLRVRGHPTRSRRVATPRGIGRRPDHVLAVGADRLRSLRVVRVCEREERLGVEAVGPERPAPGAGGEADVETRVGRHDEAMLHALALARAQAVGGELVHHLLGGRDVVGAAGLAAVVGEDDRPVLQIVDPVPLGHGLVVRHVRGPVRVVVARRRRERVVVDVRAHVHVRLALDGVLLHDRAAGSRRRARGVRGGDGRFLRRRFRTARDRRRDGEHSETKPAKHARKRSARARERRPERTPRARSSRAPGARHFRTKLFSAATMTPTMLSPAMSPDAMGTTNRLGLPLVRRARTPTRATAPSTNESDVRERQEQPEAEARRRGEPPACPAGRATRRAPARARRRSPIAMPSRASGCRFPMPTRKSSATAFHCCAAGRGELRRRAGAPGEHGRVGDEEEVAEDRGDRAGEDAEELRDELPPRVGAQQVAGLQVVEQVGRFAATRWP